MRIRCFACLAVFLMILVSCRQDVNRLSLAGEWNFALDPQDVGLQGIHDIEDKVKRAGVGASLDPGSLIMIADTLRAARTLRNSLSGSDEEDFNYPIIQSLSNGLYAYREIEDAIYNAIISELEISDNASSTLRDIRRRIVQKNQSIRSKLNSIISSTTYQKYLQDAIISVRGDRFVVPVKAEYRSQVAGIVHDQSSSGATLFIEPMSIVDMNNELRQLRLSEQEEIERILQELDYSEKIMKKAGCPVIDVSNKAIEETAGIILDIMKENGLKIYKDSDK